MPDGIRGKTEKRRHVLRFRTSPKTGQARKERERDFCAWFTPSSNLYSPYTRPPGRRLILFSRCCPGRCPLDTIYYSGMAAIVTWTKRAETWTKRAHSPPARFPYYIGYVPTACGYYTPFLAVLSRECQTSSPNRATISRPTSRVPILAVPGPECQLPEPTPGPGQTGKGQG